MIIGREVTLAKVQEFLEDVRTQSSVSKNGSKAEFLETFSDFVEDFHLFSQLETQENGVTISKNQGFSVRLNGVDLFQSQCAYEALWSAIMVHFIFNVSYNENIRNLANLIAIKVYPEMSTGAMSKRVMAKLNL